MTIMKTGPKALAGATLVTAMFGAVASAKTVLRLPSVIPA